MREVLLGVSKYLVGLESKGRWKLPLVRYKRAYLIKD